VLDRPRYWFGGDVSRLSDSLVGFVNGVDLWCELSASVDIALCTRTAHRTVVFGLLSSYGDAICWPVPAPQVELFRDLTADWTRADGRRWVWVTPLGVNRAPEPMPSYLSKVDVFGAGV
jgi:hypothetical protein